VTSAGDTSELRDGDVRREIIDATRTSLLVEAAAGTGKTRLIVDRILRGVRDATIRMPTLVAITFTEKAAAELEARVRARIAAELRRQDPVGPERKRLREAQEQLDQASICTIHSFCARVLREKPDAAGVDPEFAVLDATETEVLRQDCWREWIDRQVSEPSDRLVAALRAGVRMADLKAAGWALLDMSEAQDAPGYALERPDLALPAACAKFRAMAPPVLACVDQHMVGRGNEASRMLRDVAAMLAEGRGDDARAVPSLACRLASVELESSLTSFAKDVRPRLRGEFEPFFTAARAVASHVAADVLDWLRGFADEYGRWKAERSALDFQDLLLCTARMLREHAGARRYFQRRFGAFFVDEFQDTDPLQAELLAFLCEEPGGAPAARMEEVTLATGKLLVVGDPKQSIYRFRRADVAIYERFKALFGAGSIRRIHCNFRSHTRLLEWLNGLFERVFAAPVPEGAYQAEHVALAPPWPGMAADAVPVVVAAPPPGMDRSGWKAHDARREEARCLAALVNALVGGSIELPGHGRGFRHRDFAFLFRSMTDVAIYEDAFDAAGLPYRVLGGRHFYSRGPVVETLQLLRAVDDPLDEAAVVGALRSSFFGFSDEDLFEHRIACGEWNYLVIERGDSELGQAMAMLARWHRRRNAVAPHVLLREMFDETKALQTFLLKPDGRQRMASVGKLMTQLRQLGATAKTFGSMVGYLRGLQESRVAEEEASSVEPGDDFMLLLSMHKSKGLEFPVVVLPDLGRRLNRGTGVASLLVNRRTRRVGLRLKRGVESLGFPEMARAEEGNAKAELARLLYVACTRAQRLLVLPLHWAGDRAGVFQAMLTDTGLFPPPDEALAGRVRDGIYHVDTSALAPPDASPDRAHEGAMSADDLLKRRTDWSELHRGLAVRASGCEVLLAPSATGERGGDLAPALGGPGVGGKGVGAAFHRVMQMMRLDGAPDEAAQQAAMATAELGMDADVAEEVADLAAAAARDDRLRGLLEGAGSVAREVPFSVPFAALPVCPDDMPGFVEGSIDLLIRRRDRVIILDYKTDRTVPGDLETAAGRYWPQLGAYALAAGACGLAGHSIEVALFFVRPGVILRRRLDAELISETAAAVRRILAAERC